MTTTQSHAAVLRLFDAYFDRVYRFVRRSVDAAAAEEVAQDVFIKLLSRTDVETMQVSVSYLIKIADNMLKRRHRRGERTRELIHDLARSTAASTADREEPGLDGSVLTAFDRLGPEEQEAVRLIVCEGLSYRDAARSMGVQVSTINNWKHRGIQRLREQITAAEGDDRAAPRRGRRSAGAGAAGAAAGDRRGGERNGARLGGDAGSGCRAGSEPRGRGIVAVR